MPYIITVSPLDFGGYFSGITPVLGGSIFSPPPSTPTPPGGPTSVPVDTATSTPAAPWTLTFSSLAATGPAGPSAVLIKVTTPPGAAGDVFRSGPLSALPDTSTSPAPLTYVTVAQVTISPTTVAGTLAGLAPIPIAIPAGVVAAVVAASGGLLVPLGLTITGITAGPLGPGPTLTTLTVTGTLVVRQGLFFVVTHFFTLTVTLALAPSSDASNPARVFSASVNLTAPAPTLTATGVPGFISALLAPFAAGVVASRVESAINGSVASTAGSAAAGQGFALSPTAVISALTPIITAAPVGVLPAGITVRLGVADLLGPGVLPIPRTLSVAIAPVPVESVRTTYTVTVTDALTTGAVPGATFTLTNYDENGRLIQPPVQIPPSDQNGVTHFNTALNYKQYTARLPNGEIVTKYLSPTLRVSPPPPPPSYNAVGMGLLPPKAPDF